MNFLLTLGRWTISNGYARALILKGVRNALVWLGPVVTAFLLKHGADASATKAFVSYLGGTILSGTGVAFSLYDAKSVHAQIRLARAVPKTDAAIDRRLAEHSL